MRSSVLASSIRAVERSGRSRSTSWFAARFQRQCSWSPALQRPHADTHFTRYRVDRQTLRGPTHARLPPFVKSPIPFGFRRQLFRLKGRVLPSGYTVTWLDASDAVWDSLSLQIDVADSHANSTCLPKNGIRPPIARRFTPYPGGATTTRFR